MSLTPQSAVPPSSESIPLRPRRSRWTLACWIFLVLGSLLTVAAYQLAYINRQPGEWLPGMLQLLVGVFATGFVTFVCGLVAIIRREPRKWFALLPSLAGAYTTVYFIWCLLRR